MTDILSGLTANKGFCFSSEVPALAVTTSAGGLWNKEEYKSFFHNDIPDINIKAPL